MLVGGLVVMLGVMAVLCMHQLSVAAGWKERGRDAETLASEALAAMDGPSERRGRVRSRARVYCAKWGMVLMDDNIEEKQWK